MTLRIEGSAGIETWMIDLPEVRNALTGPETIDAFVAAADRVNADQAVRAVIITGAGSSFSSGGNLNDLAEWGQRDDLEALYRDGIQRIPRALDACDVPLIAAVNGPAVGAGCDLAMMCDIRIASTTAFFAESFVKLGLISGDGGAYFLPRAAGAARAAEMTLTGDRVDAATALEWGLVSRVVEPEALMETAHAIAARIAANPPQAMRANKRLLREARTESLDAVLTRSAQMQAAAHHTDEHKAALAAALGR